MASARSAAPPWTCALRSWRHELLTKHAGGSCDTPPCNTLTFGPQCQRFVRPIVLYL